MKNATSNSAFVTLYPYELYYSKGQVQKLNAFFNLESQTEYCGALRDWIPFVRFGGRPWGSAAVGGGVGWGLWNLLLFFLATGVLSAASTQLWDFPNVL